MMFGGWDQLGGGEDRPWRKPLIGAAIGLCWFVAFVTFAQFGLVPGRMDEAGLDERFIAAGLWGPLLVIGQMAVSIDMPQQSVSAVAIAARSAFGPVGGTACLLIGTFLAAMISFSIWRLIGQRLVTLRFIGRRQSLERLGTANALTAIVFVGYLLPTMSPNLIGLFAGSMTVLTPGRYAMAAIAGLIASSIGSEDRWQQLESAGSEQSLWSHVLFAVLVLIAAIAKWVTDRRRSAAGGE